jgi:hypothetical protein
MNQKRMMAALEKKLSHTVGYRADLDITDANRINTTAAHFMLSYTGETTPTTDDIASFFVRKFNTKITPLISTARVYTNEKLITIVGQMLNVNRDYADHRKMTPVITGAVYLDVPLQETWEVKEVEGSKVLVRKVKDDIMAMVQARKSAMMDVSSDRHRTFANLAKNSSPVLRALAMLNKGDTVKVYHNGVIYEDCVVLATSNDLVKFKKGDKSMEAPRQAVFEVTERAKDSKNSEDQKVVEYFEKAYGDPEYSHKMTGPGKSKK